MISKSDWYCCFYDCKFDNNVNFNKLISSAYSTKDIMLSLSSFAFQEDLNVKKSIKCLWNDFRLCKWSMTASTFKILIRMLEKISKSAKFVLHFESIFIEIDDVKFASLLKTLKISSPSPRKDLIKIISYSCNSSFLKKLVK